LQYQIITTLTAVANKDKENKFPFSYIILIL